MKKKIEKKESSEARSWRDISQTAEKELVTRLTRRRRRVSLFRKVTITLVGMGVLTGFGYGGYQIFVEGKEVISSKTSENLRSIKFGSDGVLDSVWADKWIEIRPETGMMDVDIYEIKARLEDFRQIKSATVTRRFPDEIHISVREREPILRVRTKADKLSHEDFLVGRDGVVFKGWNYLPESINALPYIGGVKFVREKNGTRKVDGISRIVELLDATRNRHLGMIEGWRVVSCEDCLGEGNPYRGMIKIRSENVREIAFSPVEFPAQLEKLNRILQQAQDWGIQYLKRVDLSKGDQVVVEFYSKLNPRMHSNP